MLQKATNGQIIDLIIDGPPCQSYSTLGKRQMDDRAEPYIEFLKFVRKNGKTTLIEHTAPKNNPQIIALMEALKNCQTKNDLPEKLRPKSGYSNTYVKLW